MSEISFVVADQQVAAARLDPNSSQVREMAGSAIPHMPFELQFLPGDRKRDAQHAIARYIRDPFGSTRDSLGVGEALF
jgi:hypothetical protein